MHLLEEEIYTPLGAVVVVIVWYLDLQLPVQSVPITPIKLTAKI